MRFRPDHTGWVTYKEVRCIVEVCEIGSYVALQICVPLLIYYLLIVVLLAVIYATCFLKPLKPVNFKISSTSLMNVKYLF
jgi:hypothetical protein